MQETRKSETHSGRVALITGSTRNIGKAIALHLAGEGFRVALNHISDDERGEAALHEVKKKSPESILVKADVSTEEGASHLIDSTASAFGQLDVLVNNVGPFLLKGVTEMTIDEWRLMIDGNLTSVFLTCRQAIPLMREAGGGHIINIGTANAGIVTALGAYGIAKTGVVLLTRYIAKTEGKHGIRANCINPGFIETDEYTPEMISDMQKRVPLGRLGAPEDIASAVSFLLSSDAAYINGAVIDVAGGLWV